MMGTLVESLMQTCECCGITALPLSVSGRYANGKHVVYPECSQCGYARKHGGFGPLGQKESAKKAKKRLKAKRYGPLSRMLISQAMRDA